MKQLLCCTMLLCCACGVSALSTSDSAVVVNEPSQRANHIWFPIAVDGPHGDVACVACHTGATFQEIACTSCHEHAQETMANVHVNVTNYQYSTAACFSCHPHPQVGAP